MENLQIVNVSTVTNIMRIPVNQTEQGSDQDAMARRIKNRERQRRYRARKRLLADLKKAQAIGPSIPSQRNAPASDTPQQYVTRVHCRRNWKKDARRAHILREQETRSNSTGNLAPTLGDEGQETSLPPGASIDAKHNSGSNPSVHVLDNSETRKHVPSRRRWKAEARNKKS